MAKLLRCRDVGIDCRFDVRAENEETVVKIAAVHAEIAHHVDRISSETVERFRAAIRDE